MADVFISYHKKSAGDIAATIADALESVGISCWYARRDIPIGADFAQYIPPQIDACKVFLIILSEHVYQSKHIENELGLAFSRLNHGEKITILPLEIGNFERKEWIKYYLIHTQSIKFSSLDETRIQTLTEKIADILGRSLPPPLKYPPSRVVKRGFCGDHVTYSLSESGLLTLSGTGDMWSYEWTRKTGTANTPWWGERSTVSRVLIESGVTSIAKYAFCNCVNLSSAIIPDSITKIEIGAFDTCTLLTSVQIPDGVTKIETGTFNGCTSLTSVEIPNSVTKIEFGAFSDCLNLVSVSIPDSVTNIGLGAFSGCTNLTVASVPSKTKINFFAFPENTAIMRRRT